MKYLRLIFIQIKLNVVHVKKYDPPSIICNSPTVFTQSLTKRWTTNCRVTLQHKIALSGLTETDSTSNGIIWSDTFTIITEQKAVADHISPQTVLNLWFLCLFPAVNRKPSIYISKPRHDSVHCDLHRIDYVDSQKLQIGLFTETSGGNLFATMGRTIWTSKVAQ